MRYRAGDLAVLNAESYEDGRRHDLSSDKTEITAAHVEHPESQGRSTRKRRKTVSPDAAGREEESRRSRGRPRLQPKDETAQDVSHSVFYVHRLCHVSLSYCIIHSHVMRALAISGALACGFYVPRRPDAP